MKKLLFLIMSCVLALGLVGGAFAYFSDTATSTTNSFTSGTLSIQDSGITSATAFTIDCMAPGDVTDWYVIEIVNDGCINLGWLGDWQFTGTPVGGYDLRNALYIAEAKMEFITPEGDESWLDDSTVGYEPVMVDHFITNGGPSGPYGAYLHAVDPTFGVYTLSNFNDNPDMVPGSVYEHAGALKAGYKYRLSVKFGFAAAAGNEYQGLGPVTAQLQVNATQIVAAALIAQGVPAASAPAIVTWMNTQIADQTES